MTIRWPEKVLRPQSVAFDIAPRTVAGPSTVAGASQVIASSAGIWTAQFANVVVNSRDRVIAWRAIAALLEGRLGSILVPLCRGYQPVPAGAVEAGLYDPVPHDDDAYFDDDTGYVGQVIDVQLTAGIAVGGTSGSIAVTYAGTIQPGQHFSLGDYLYRLKTVVWTSETVANITFTPPLREAAVTADSLNFDDPVVKMRLATDQEMDMLLDGRRLAYPTVNFVEDI